MMKKNLLARLSTGIVSLSLIAPMALTTLTPVASASANAKPVRAERTVKVAHRKAGMKYSVKRTHKVPTKKHAARKGVHAKKSIRKRGRKNSKRRVTKHRAKRMTKAQRVNALRSNINRLQRKLNWTKKNSARQINRLTKQIKTYKAQLFDLTTTKTQRKEFGELNNARREVRSLRRQLNSAAKAKNQKHQSRRTRNANRKTVAHLRGELNSANKQARKLQAAVLK